MKRMRRTKNIAWMFVFIFFMGCTSLSDFKPASVDEQSVKEFFLFMQDVRNKRDVKGVLGLYHDNAKIMSGRERKMSSKKGYAESLGDLEGAGKIQFGAPKMIKFYENGGRVEVDISMIAYKYQKTLKMKFFLIRSNNGWLAIKRTYTIN